MHSAIVLFITLFILLAIGCPIGFALGLAACATIISGVEVPFTVAVQRMVAAADSFPLMALPFFILGGNLMETGGISRRLVNFVNSLVGWLSGGLAIVTIAASMFFGAISGSATATTAAIGSIMIPGMNKKGYDPVFGAAVTASSGLLGAIIPPSLMMVTYGTLTGVSVSALFIGGFIPGTLMGLSLMVISFFIAKKSGYVSTETFNIINVFKTFYQAIFALLMPLIVLGGIYGGIFTPTEASVVAVVYALVVGLYIYKELTWSDIPRILFGSAKTSGSIMFLVSTASFFGWIMARERIPQMIAEIMLSISNDTVVILLMINILLLVVGCFVESLATIIILTPILFPLITNLGVDPLHFGIILCINVAVGTLTPPFGVCLFVASGITGIPLEKIALKAMPFMIALILNVLILTYLPAITLFLPKLLAGN